MTIDVGTDLALDENLDLPIDGGVYDGVRDAEPALLQVALIRLSTPRGGCIEAPNDGINLVEWLSKDMGPDEIASLEGTIVAELLKDERFTQGTRATVNADLLLTEGTMTVELELATAAGPFRGVLSVSEAGVAILGGTL